jgi:hypothetical protein
MMVPYWRRRRKGGRLRRFLMRMNIKRKEGQRR